MFSKLFVLGAALPVVLGLTLNTPTNVTSGLSSDISWTSTDSDPSFSVELNHPSFHNAIAIANNVNPQSTSSMTIEWPIVPADDQYTLNAVNISNINSVFSTTSPFAIAQAPTTAANSSAISTTFTSGVTVSGASTTGASTTGASTSAGSSGSTGSASAPASTGSTGSFNGGGSNGALSSFRTGNAGVVIAVLGAIAGVTLVL